MISSGLDTARELGKQKREPVLRQSPGAERRARKLPPNDFEQLCAIRRLFPHLGQRHQVALWLALTKIDFTLKPS